MKAVIQRVARCQVKVADTVVGQIQQGICVLLGVATGDTSKEADWLVNKIIGLRIFEDDAGKMNRSLLDVGGQLMVVSQFTLLGDCRKGRRPSFVHAAEPEQAQALYKYFIDKARQRGVVVETGQFGAMMAVSLVNDGPVTLILETT